MKAVVITLADGLLNRRLLHSVRRHQLSLHRDADVNARHPLVGRRVTYSVIDGDSTAPS